MSNGFTSKEHLKSKLAFDNLFKEGKSIKAFPVRLVYVPWQSDSPNGIQVGFSVPKKRFKLAVDRNRIKRQLREAYRLNKSSYLTEPKQQWALLFIYLPAEKLEYQSIESGIQRCLKRFAQEQSIL